MTKNLRALADKALGRLRSLRLDAARRAERLRQNLREAWNGMEDAQKAILVLGLVAAGVLMSITLSRASKVRLESNFPSVSKIHSSGALLPTDKLSFGQDSIIRAAKQLPDATIVEFFDSKQARGPVDRLRLVKSGDRTWPFIVGPVEAAALNDYLRSKDRIDSMRFVDYETLPASEKAAVDGLSLRMAPADFRDEEQALQTVMLLANVGITALMLGFILQMMRQGQKALKFIRPSKIQGSLSDLVGMEDIKSEVLRVKDHLANRDAYLSYGVERPNNILFSGPPGTGKTKLAGFLAKELGLPILFHSAANLETGFVNGGPQTLEKALAMARREGRCVIFLDEAQDLFMKRGQSGRKFDDDTQNTLLSILDGVRSVKDSEIIWIVASNFNSNSMEMDEAMLRRFQTKIDFRLPNAEERAGIFSHYLARAGGNVEDGIDLAGAVHITEQRSPADIESIVHEAAVSAIALKSPITSDLLLGAAERHLIGNTDEAATAGRDRDRRTIAIHEVGHFLCDLARHCPGGDLALAAHAKDKVSAIKISLKANARSGALGFVLKRPPSSMLQTKSDIEWDVVGLFGGMANEELHHGPEGVTTGAYSDIQEVTRLLSRAVSGLGLYKPSKLNFSALANPRDPSHVSDEDRAAMAKASEELYARALALLSPVKDLSCELAAALVESVEMKASDMVDMVAAHFERARSAPHGSEAQAPRAESCDA